MKSDAGLSFWEFILVVCFCIGMFYGWIPWFKKHYGTGKGTTSAKIEQYEQYSRTESVPQTGTGNESQIRLNSAAPMSGTYQEGSKDFVEYAQNALAVIISGEMTSTGFVGLMNARKYLFFDASIIREGVPTRAKMLDGTIIQVTNHLEVAENQTIVRFEVPSTTKALVIKNGVPRSRNRVVLFKNNNGAGVFENMQNEILAVGPDKIELLSSTSIDSNGSPVLDTNGFVIAMASYNGFLDGKNHSNNRQETYNIMTRLQNIKWNNVSTNFCSEIARGRQNVNETETKTDLFQIIRDTVVIINTGDGSGTGFIAKMGAKKYLFTNEHVIHGRLPIHAKTLNGEELQLGQLFDIAQNRDIVRFEVNEAKQALKFEMNAPSLNDFVVVYGNSDGAGVATETKGVINGVGPDAIETTARIVQGNSGSPMLNQTGKVLGIITHVIRYNEPENWIKEKTRYNETRRFAARFFNIKWVRMDVSDYIKRVNVLNDVEAFCFFFYEMNLPNANYVDQNTPGFIYDDRSKSRYIQYFELHSDLKQIAYTYNKVWSAMQDVKRCRSIFEEEDSRAQGGKYRNLEGRYVSRASVRAEADYKNALSIAKSCFKQYQAAREIALRDARRLLPSGIQFWISQRLEENAKNLSNFLEWIVLRSKSNC